MIETKETFSVGNMVYFRNPEGLYADKLSLYIKAAGMRGPFTVLVVQENDNSEAHPQILTLGNSIGDLLTVSYGGGLPEPLEVSGFWLTKKA